MLLNYLGILRAWKII